MTQSKIIEETWKEHIKVCGTCRKIGKWNNRGGTTDCYHSFVQGFVSCSDKTLTTLQKENKWLNDYINLCKDVKIHNKLEKDNWELKSQLQEKDKEIFISKSAIATLKIFHKKQKEEIFKEIKDKWNELYHKHNKKVPVVLFADFMRDLEYKHLKQTKNNKVIER